jgi:hypothetical protein
MSWIHKLSRRLAQNHRSLGLLALLAVSACGGSDDLPTDPDAKGGGNPKSTATPGWLVLSLNTPNANDGAIRLTVTGGGIDSVRLASAYRGFAGTDGVTGWVAATGAVTGGEIARIWVPDTRNTRKYSAGIIEVAEASSYYLRPSTSGYFVSVIRP